MPAQLSDSRGLVLFSGGQDSTTCLAWALSRFAEVETVGFDYGQRHRVELECRHAILQALGAAAGFGEAQLGPDRIIALEALAAMSDTALTRDVAITMGENGLPSTFVPGRNLIFLAFAAALAYRPGCRHLVLGVCETDYSGTAATIPSRPCRSSSISASRPDSCSTHR